ncbi:helix-turn-helix transcriptional regulator [Euzebya tangerina]|uniref:helix-turn-helix transcriptional regulator n=1 Tax=Euzebya tangerina TaxID=591198 RepID=UPI000E30F6CA|nr:LuxR C-terminal-related transcriptional regulator [Euzebya tangerina]
MTRAVLSTPPPLPDAHVARPALVRRVTDHAVTVVVAGGGWGKSTLASEVAASFRGNVAWTSGAQMTGVADAAGRILDPLGLSDLAPGDTELDGSGTADAAWSRLADRVAEALRRRRRPHLIVIDEVTPLTWPAVAAIAHSITLLHEAEGSRHRLIALGRELDVAAARRRGVVLGGADLALTVEEFDLLLTDVVPSGLTRGLSELLVRRTGGWLTVLRSILGALATSPSPDQLARQLAHSNVALETVVSGMLTDVPAATREAAGVAAGLPVLDARLARRLAVDDAVRAVVRAGLPWETPEIGLWTLPDPVADLLAPPRATDDVVDLVVQVYAASGLHLEAARYAVANDQAELAAASLAAAPSHELTAAFTPSVLAVLRSFDDQVRAAQPGIHTQIARLLTASARYEERNSYVRTWAPKLRDDAPEVAAALQAERFRDLAYFSPTPDPADIDAAEELLGSVRDLATRSRLEQGLALLLARRDGVAAAEAGLRRAAEAAERAGDLEQAALVLRDLAWVVLLELGRLRQVVETFDRIEAMLGPDTQATAWRINRAETHLWLGDLEAAEQDLDIASRLAELQHDDQHVAYAAWARATCESMRGRGLATLAAVQRAEAVAGDWLETVTGVLFYAQVADALARAGLEADARARLARAQDRRAEDPRAVAVAELGLEARLGDPVTALELAHSIDLDEQEPFEVPRIMLLRALARHRGGEDATDEAGRAFAAYAAIGLLEAAPVAEREACRELVPLVRAAGGVVPQVASSPVDPGSSNGPGSEPLSTADLSTLLTSQFGLRPREAEVLLALRTGGSNAEIGASLGISPATVRKHLQHAYATLDVRSRTEALVLLGSLG